MQDTRSTNSLFPDDLWQQLDELTNATDEHAEVRLPLLTDCAAALRAEASPQDAHLLADKIERWRYQLLRHTDLWQDGEQRLVDLLDLLANRLAGRPARGPRATRSALGELGAPDDFWLEPSDVCLKDVVCAAAEPARRESLLQQATALTAEQFAEPEAPHVVVEGETAGTYVGPRRRMLIYAPLYLSNHCVNYCQYCWFRYPQPMERRCLTVDAALREADLLAARGIEHILLVAGDFPQLMTPEYFEQCVETLTRRGFSVSLEAAPQSTEVYERLVAAGLTGVAVYQETYDESRYAVCHPHGTKAAFNWRLESLDRAAEAGVVRLGLGILLGLADPWADLQRMIAHGRYLQERFPHVKLGFSLPRIHEAPSELGAPVVVRDEVLELLYVALRLSFPDANLLLSTRETQSLRDRLAPRCVSQMSAGSSTTPGGYTSGVQEGLLQQFPIFDQRSVAEVVESLERAGLTIYRNEDAGLRSMRSPSETKSRKFGICL